MKYILSLFTTLILAQPALLHAAKPVSGREVPLAFVKQHCVECHNDSTSEGGFRADLLGKELADSASQKSWSRVLARVQSGEMPPPQDTVRPAEAEVGAALTALKTAFHEDALTKHGESGRVRVRRLNRLEYENTVRDLLGIDAPPRDLLPEDDLRDGFNNQAGGLSISPIHVQQYMAAADRALEAASVRQARQDVLLHDSIVGEPRVFFRDLVERDLGAALLVSARHAFLNQRLAEHYDLPSVKGAGLRRVDLPADSVRGGLLTQASILKVTANGANTSPVLRGAWLLERIVGTPAPPPPPNAGGIEPDTRGATNIREQLSKHQSVKTCADCHQKIDPPSFALEAFDPIGRYRDYYRTTETGQKLPETRVFFDDRYGGVKFLKGPSVDTRSQLPGGTEIADVRTYKAALAARPEQLARSLVRKLATFATGANVEVGDELIVDAILKKSQASNFGLRTLIHEVVQSELVTRK